VPNEEIIQEVDTLFCLIGGSGSLTPVTDYFTQYDAHNGAPWDVPEDIKKMMESQEDIEVENNDQQPVRRNKVEAIHCKR